jgi:hypothetical protein
MITGASPQLDLIPRRLAAAAIEAERGPELFPTLRTTWIPRWSTVSVDGWVAECSRREHAAGLDGRGRLHERGRAAKLAESTDGDVREMKISIIKPKERKRETVGVGAKGDAREEGSSENPNSSDSPVLPDDPEVLPDVPDTPPPEDKTGE